MQYYPIDETLARRANSMNSYSDYVKGSATAAYRADVDRAAELAEQQKRKVDPIHHEKIDRLLDTYARRLAENTNRRNEIAARVPSILVAGGSNFPVRKKEKQNRADDAAMAEWKEIQGLLDKIRGAGMGGISADDPEAVAKLKEKVERLEQFQTTMKEVNAYYRKHKTLDGCPLLSPEEIEKLKAQMARSWRADPKPYESYALTNNNAAIRQAKARIKELSEKAETEYEGWAFNGGEVKMDRDANRLQVFFDEKPDRETCSAMRHGGFRWAPSVGAWQRQLNNNAIWAARHMDCLRPLSAEQPTQTPEQAEPAVDQDNSHASSSTPGSIGAQYYNLLHACYPMPEDEDLRTGQIEQITQYLQKEGKNAAHQLALAAAGMGAAFSDNAAVQELASSLMKELAQYQGPGRDDVRRQKPLRNRSQEW